MKVLIHIEGGTIKAVYVDGASEPVVAIVEDGASRVPLVRPLSAAPDWLAAAID